MNRHEGDRLITVIRELMGEEGAASVGRVGKGRDLPAASQGTIAPAKPIEPSKPAEPLKDVEIGGMKFTAEMQEALFRNFYNRMIDQLRLDPIALQLLASQPEIILEIQTREVSIDASSVRGRVARLIATGFFDAGKRQGECRTELTRTGTEPNSGQLSTLFADFVKDGFLERTQGDRYIKAPGLKITEKKIAAS